MILRQIIVSSFNALNVHPVASYEMLEAQHVSETDSYILTLQFRPECSKLSPNVGLNFVTFYLCVSNSISNLQIASRPSLVVESGVTY